MEIESSAPAANSDLVQGLLIITLMCSLGCVEMFLYFLDQAAGSFFLLSRFDPPSLNLFLVVMPITSVMYFTKILS